MEVAPGGGGSGDRDGKPSLGRDLREPLRSQEVGRQRRKELQRSFAPELASREVWVLDAADAASSGAFWDSLRQAQALSVKRAGVVLQQTLRSLLG